MNKILTLTILIKPNNLIGPHLPLRYTTMKNKENALLHLNVSSWYTTDIWEIPASYWSHRAHLTTSTSFLVQEWGHFKQNTLHQTTKWIWPPQCPKRDQLKLLNHKIIAKENSWVLNVRGLGLHCLEVIDNWWANLWVFIDTKRVDAPTILLRVASTSEALISISS